MVHDHCSGEFVELARDLERQLKEALKRTLQRSERIQELNKHEARLKWLHDCSTGQTDPEGYEWGIYRVKWEKGYAVAVLQTNSDLSDLDAEMARELNTP